MAQCTLPCAIRGRAAHYQFPIQALVAATLPLDLRAPWKELRRILFSATTWPNKSRDRRPTLGQNIGVAYS